MVAARALAVLFAFFALAACDRAPGGSASAVKFNAIDVTGADYGKEFTLTDHDGKKRTLADFQGKAVLFFFGFTHCPDYCPSALARFDKALELLGAESAKVQVVFFTLDPERDDAQTLKQYVTGFDPSFLGLYTDLETTRKTAQHFRIFFEKQPADGASYNVDHTVGAYVFDPQSRLRLFIAGDLPPEKIAEDLRALLR